MKKIISSLLISASFAFANDATIVSMHDMEAGLDSIQKGFLYNQVDMIENDAESNSKEIKKLLNVEFEQK